MAQPARSESASLRARVRAWDVWSTPRLLLALLGGVELLTLGAAAYFVLTSAFDGQSIARFGLLLGLSVAFEEVEARVEHFRFRFSIGRYNDMTSVWTFAGAIVLPAGLAVLLIVGIRLHMWFRHQRRSGLLLYRQAFTGASIVLACLAAHATVQALGTGMGMSASGAPVLAGVVLAIIVYASVNHLLVFAAIVLASRPFKPPAFFRSWHDNALELATLGLAGLAALALLYEPWLTVLVLPSMAVLQRGVFTKELEMAATTDAKTGLLNALTWRQLADRELMRAERESHVMSMLIVDMDNFKHINDTYGHLVGDAVLKAVADSLAHELRGYDAVGRFGGEEFVALLTDVDVMGSIDVAERLLARIRELQVPTRDGDDVVVANLTASIGVACYPGHGAEIEDLLHSADSALYTAKNAGRDRVAISGGEPGADVAASFAS